MDRRNHAPSLEAAYGMIRAPLLAAACAPVLSCFA
jgi:hypothetical protein